MKLKLLILLTILATSGYYFWQDPKQHEKIMGKVHQIAPELNKSTLYKWQDSNGNWNITDKPPKKGTAYKTISSDDQLNVIPNKAFKKNN